MGEFRTRLPGLGVPTAWLAALPACPACYPGYAALLGSLGLGALVDVRAQIALTAAVLVLVLATLGWRPRERRGLGPLALGVGAALLVAVGKLALDSSFLTYGGATLLSVAALWNAWPRAHPEACAACAGGPEAGGRAR